MGLTHYEVLGVSPDADKATVRAAYRQLVRMTHPDAGGSSAEFAAVALAWSVLSSPEARARYDESLAGVAAGWGEEVDLGWAGKPPPPSEPWPPVHGGNGEPTGAPPRGRIDPLTSVPLVLPSLDRVLARVPVPVARPARWALLVAVGAMLAPAILVIALAGEVTRPAGPRVSAGGFFLCVTWAAGLFVITYLRALVIDRDRIRPEGAAMVLVAVVILVGLGAMVATDQPDGPTRTDLVSAMATAAFVATAVVGCLAIEWRIRRVERVLAKHRVLARRHRAAAAWNALLADKEGTSGGSIRRREPTDPMYGAGWWILFDGEGNRCGEAPSSAPAAWVELLREFGLDVADAPGGEPQR